MNRFRQIKQEILQSGAVLPKVYWDDPYTFVHLIIDWNGRDFESVGFAKRHPNDEWNEVLGLEIAMGRAVHKAAKAIAFEIAAQELRRSMRKGYPKMVRPETVDD